MTPTPERVSVRMRRDNPRTKALAAHHGGDLATAELLYTELLRSSPRDPELMHYMGVLCHQTGRSSESIQWLRDALALAPKSLPTLQLLIRVCAETGDTTGALDFLNQYLSLQPNDAIMLNIKGQQLVRIGHLREAEPAFRQAAEFSGTAAMFRDLGLCRQWLGEHAGAVMAYEEAIRRGHDHPITRLWLAQCLRATGRTKEYYDVATDAARTTPDNVELLLEAQSARRYVCDWQGFYANQPQLRAGLDRALKTDAGPDIPPGILNYLEVDEGMIAAIARRHARQLSIASEPLQRKLSRPPPQSEGGKIRLGYLSTDFFAHAVGSLVQNLFACHDRNRFEVYGYSLRHQPDAIQSRIQQGCDRYRNLSGSSATDIIQAISTDRIDILIDLAGYTSTAQPTVLAARPAPIQVSWLGYLGTTGSQFIDYVIADDMVLPHEIARHYTERIIRLPCFLVASPLSMAEQRLSRQDAGLGAKSFVFCSFNQPYKLDHATFEAWMEILRQVAGSQLWLYTPDTEVCATNLRRVAARLDVDPERLVFAPRVPMDAHVARVSLADLALDPFHISGGATSVATLRAGVPVLTLRGNSFLARMGSSINARLRLDDLDCSGPAEYVAKAVTLASESHKLADVKDRLLTNLQSGGLFDTATFAGLLEQGLLSAWKRHKARLPTADITIPEPTLVARSIPTPTM